MTVYDRTLQALHLMDYMDKDMFGQARDVLGQAMEEDPLFAMPVAWSIWWYIIWVGQGWSTIRWMILPPQAHWPSVLSRSIRTTHSGLR